MNTNLTKKEIENIKQTLADYEDNFDYIRDEISSLHNKTDSLEDKLNKIDDENKKETEFEKTTFNISLGILIGVMLFLLIRLLI